MTKEELKQEWEEAQAELKHVTKKFSDLTVNAATVASKELADTATSIQKEWAQVAERAQAAMKAFFEK